MTLQTRTAVVTEAHRRYDVEAIPNDLMPRDDSGAVGVLLRPAFHAETLLRYEPRTRTITMSAYARSLWYLVAELCNPAPTTKERLVEKYRGVTAPPPAIEIWSETAAIGTGAAAIDGGLVAAFRRAEAEGGPRHGVDGISLRGFCFEGGDESRFEAWSPTFDSEAHRFVHLLYRCARESLRSDEVEQRLEELHGYLGLGLPWKVVSETPLVIRIFGSLSASDEPELRRALDGLPRTEPVVLDLSRLAGMGSLLHPVWRSWLQERDNVLWVVGDDIARHLDSIGVSAGARHPDLASALRELR
ncbi:MAG: hypothetical protein HOW73_24110 [Polyangiaceae bacterium]|nr:hypothetical protein [Polyangiaceae bacterium]